MTVTYTILDEEMGAFSFVEDPDITVRIKHEDYDSFMEFMADVWGQDEPLELQDLQPWMEHLKKEHNDENC